MATMATRKRRVSSVRKSETGRRHRAVRQGLTPMAQKATRKLLAACRHLCEALAKVGPAQREAVITDLSQGLRQELICMREAQKNRLHCSKQGSSRTIGSGQNDFNSSRPLRGNIWCVKTAAGCYNRVRLTLDGVAITSARLPSRDVAQSCLSHLRLAAKLAADEGGGTDAILRAIDAAGSSMTFGEGRLGLSYQAVLDARRTMGRRLHSASYTSVEEAILLRHQVSNIADAGPSEVARTWLQWAQELRHRRGRKWCWSKQKAEGIFSERKKSEIPYGRGIKSLKLRVQRAEAALLEVARVSDAVSAAKRRWMPLSEATKRYPRCPSMADKVMELCQGRSWCHKDIELHRVAAADRAQLPR